MWVSGGIRATEERRGLFPPSALVRASGLAAESGLRVVDGRADARGSRRLGGEGGEGGEKGMEVGIEGGEVSDQVLWINQQAV